MKQGSTDDPFAEDPDVDADTTAEDSDDMGDVDGPGSETPPRGSQTETNQPRRLPYKYRRESVKEGREQRPIFLRPEVEDGISDLVSDLEGRLGEDVYKTDVMEAAIAVAQERPDLLADELRDWGYDWE